MRTTSQTKTVLLLERHEACRATTKSMLSAYGYDCINFESVDGAAPFIRENPKCIVLADCAFAQTILEDAILKANSRVIAMSADAAPQIKSDCLSSGAQHFLTKPYEPSRLLSLLAEMSAD